MKALILMIACVFSFNSFAESCNDYLEKYLKVAEGITMSVSAAKISCASSKVSSGCKLGGSKARENLKNGVATGKTMQATCPDSSNQKIYAEVEKIFDTFDKELNDLGF